jgi:hypothetical protein
VGATGTVSELDTAAGFLKQSSKDPMVRMVRVVVVGVRQRHPQLQLVGRQSLLQGFTKQDSPH